VNRERIALPCLNAPDQPFRLWTVLKELIGKDISRVSMPVQINCPLSGLQLTIEREAHNLEFITKASQETDSLKRLATIAVFSVVRSILFKDRVMKPFNSLLGETYELVTPTYRLIAEQVSHHPPISACIIQGDGYIFEQCLLPKIKFNGRSIAAEDEGNCIITL
jgi:hypothetical protein